MKLPVLGKLAALGAVGLALAWALASVSGIVAERQGRLHEAQRSVAASLASAQAVLGPVLQRECNETWLATQGEGKERKSVAERRDFTLRALPRSLDVDADARTEPRYRGIFRVNGYVLKATLSAQWSDAAALQPQRTHDGSQLSCAAPTLWVALSDTRGIRAAQVRLQGQALAVAPGAASGPHARGLHADWPSGLALDSSPLRAAIVMELVGTEQLAFAPIGDATQVHLASDWPHPSFDGSFLPESRNVTPRGFDATWRLSALATRAPQDVRQGLALCRPGDAQNGGCIETFGVSLIDPVSPYVLADRATKYGFLFIALTFVAVALVEALRRLRVHPLQYLLVGCALALFFLLLVSLSEHLPFAWAYLAASGACTALLAYYGAHVLHGWRAGLAFGAAIALLYAVLYVLLQMEQTALLLGALLLFAVLAAVMLVTRRIDWYALFAQMRTAA